MIKVKHFLEPVEPDDGLRMWVEPIGLTKDLRQWCGVEHVMPHLGPPRNVWEWFGQHPDEYEVFRGQYHQCLSHSHYRPALQRLACAGMRENFTLLHAGDDPEHTAPPPCASSSTSWKPIARPSSPEQNKLRPNHIAN